MSDQSSFQEQSDALLASWNNAKSTIADSEPLAASLPEGVTLQQIDEVVRILCLWASRLRAPHGFRPVFPFARIQFATAFDTLAKQATNLASNPATHLPGFLSQLMTCFVPLSCATIFADKSEKLRQMAEAQAELEQAIILTQTAQAELEHKLQKLSQAEAAANQIDLLKKKIEEIEKTAAIQGESISELQEEATNGLADIEKIRTESTEANSLSSELHSKNDALLSQLSRQRDEFTEFVAESKRQSDRVHQAAIQQKELIDSLLSELDPGNRARG